MRIGTIKSYEKALVITVYHELDGYRTDTRSAARTDWNSIICFKDRLRAEVTDQLAPGDLVHFEGYVRTTTFTDDADAKRRAVDLVITRFDLLH